MNKSELNAYYNKFDEEHRLTTRHGTVEFQTSLKYILQNLPEPNTTQASGTKILDIGAGTGRYSVSLARMGFDVTAVELCDRNIKVLRDKHENVKTWQGDARNLHFLEDNTFDLTLIFGPLYHLHGDEEKLKAFSEASRVTKKGGTILAAYVMNDYSILTFGFRQNNILTCLKNGSINDQFHTVSSEKELYDYVRLEDIQRLNQMSGLERIKIIAADGASDYFRRELNAMDEETFQAFIRYHQTVCERQDLMGASSHTVDILRNTKE